MASPLDMKDGRGNLFVVEPAPLFQLRCYQQWPDDPSGRAVSKQIIYQLRLC